jgi:hypothetical protein
MCRFATSEYFENGLDPLANRFVRTNRMVTVFSLVCTYCTFAFFLPICVDCLKYKEVLAVPSTAGFEDSHHIQW